MTRLLALLAALLFAGTTSAYEEEADLPAGEWMILEGRSEEAVTWYRTRHAKNPGEWQEGLAEALWARASDLLALEKPDDALPLLREAEQLTRDSERTERIQYLIAYAEKKTTGHAVLEGHRSLVTGDVASALASYERALEDARDEFERRQGRTLVALSLLLKAVVSTDGTQDAERAATVWPAGEALVHDVRKFLWIAPTSPVLRRRLQQALEHLPETGGEQTLTLRGTALCVLERTEEAERSLRGVQRPGWREPLDALLRQAKRLKDWKKAGGKRG